MAATDPLYTTTEPGTDLLVATVAAAVRTTLLDRTGGGILGNPVIANGFIGKEKFLRALGAAVVYINLGADKLQTVAQGTDATFYDLASDKATVTPVRKAFARGVSDWFRTYTEWAPVQWGMFARDATVAFQQTVVSLLCANASSITATGGNTGGAATWAQVVADFQTLGIASVAPPYVLITRPKDFANIATDAFSVGGWIEQSSDVLRYLQSVNPGYKGSFMGGQLDIYTTDETEVSGGDNLSIMAGKEALLWNVEMPSPSPATTPILWTPLYGVELDRDGLKNEDDVVTSSHIGTGIGINAAGIQMPFLT